MAAETSPRVGVFICRCGINIGGVVNVTSVVEYAKTLSGVAYAEENLYTCSSEGLGKIKDAIKKHGLQRVVVASCTPRTHEPLFQATCVEAGLNKYLFEMANIRDQCSWVHMHEHEGATEKAKDLVRMAVAKAKLLEPEDEPVIDVIPSALVIGGGVSGLTSALSLANQGFKVHLVEKQPDLGGMLLKLDKLFPEDQDSSDILKSVVELVRANHNIDVHTSARVKSVKGFIGNFEFEVEIQGKGALKLSAGTIIVASGAEYLKPGDLYGYGKDGRIVTQLQLEELLKKGVPGDIRSVVMIQCAGSRNEERPYCSRICCNVAMSNALRLTRGDHSKNVYILYRDLQTYGTQAEKLDWRAKKQGVKLIYYIPERPPQVIPKGEGLVVKVFSPLLNEELALMADLVVLSVPLIPGDDNKELSQMLKVPLDSDGFFMEAHVKLRPIDFATDGIFVCGTAHSPKDVGESVAQALGVASRAAIPMDKGKVSTAAITSKVDESKCSGCGTCIELCPYNAIQKNEKELAQVTSAVCKGCGVCGASCPERAIVMHHFTNEQIEAQVFAALEKVEG